MLRLNLTPGEVVFFGDAEADFNAAQVAGVQFIARTENPKLFPPNTFIIKDFTDLL